ncbi:hypothetical protein HRbin20_01781 [bacterium HR20]|nr:hypothetical protein HRbin20_01781 [bacterium HR20]
MLARHLEHCFRCSAWIDAARICDHPYASGNDIFDYCIHRLDKIASIAPGWIAQFLLLEDGHCYLCQVVHHKVVNRSAADLHDRRCEQIAPEPLSRCDANGMLHT